MMKLTPNLLSALDECDRYNARGLNFWWRVSSMAKLEAMGLVEKFTPPSVAERKRMTKRPYILTEAGRTALREGETT